METIGLLGAYGVVGANYLPTLFNCQLQKLVNESIAAKYIILFLLIAFAVPLGNNLSGEKKWIRIIYVYILYILASRTHVYVCLFVLFLIVMQQLFNDITSDRSWSDAIDYLVPAIIVLGAVYYGYQKYREYGTTFNVVSFFFKSDACKSLDSDPQSSTNATSTENMEA